MKRFPAKEARKNVWMLIKPESTGIGQIRRKAEEKMETKMETESMETEKKALSPEEINLEEMDQAAGGRKFPSKEIVGIISSAVCGGHDWVQTGRERERSFFVFWSKHQHQYICSKCGEKCWKDD